MDIKQTIIITMAVGVLALSNAFANDDNNNELTQGEVAIMMAYSEGVDLLVKKYSDAGQVKLSELRTQARDIAVAILSKTRDYDPVSEKTRAVTEQMTGMIVELASSLLKDQGAAVIDDSVQAESASSSTIDANTNTGASDALLSAKIVKKYSTYERWPGHKHMTVTWHVTIKNIGATAIGNFRFATQYRGETGKTIYRGGIDDEIFGQGEIMRRIEPEQTRTFTFEEDFVDSQAVSAAIKLVSCEFIYGGKPVEVRTRKAVAATAPDPAPQPKPRAQTFPEQRLQEQRAQQREISSPEKILTTAVKLLLPVGSR